ncbi:MAG: ATP-dependent DNA helicase [Magnetospirillum sp. WYHS-4]
MHTRPAPIVRLPDAPALVAGVRGAVWLEPDGRVESLAHRDAARRMSWERPPLVCHFPSLAKRLKGGPPRVLDLLELFAFVRPARFCLPTPRGLAQALDLPLPANLEQEAASLYRAAQRLLEDLAGQQHGARIAWTMARAGWSWGPSVLAALGADREPHAKSQAGGLRIWDRLPEWSDFTPEPPDGHWPVEAVEARARLVKLLGSKAEKRPQQADYAEAAAKAFLPRDKAGEPRVVLAEAGTGVGKTLGYIAPASVWAEKNKGTVWISTFTRNLQRQLDAELDRLYPDPHLKARKAVVRKGRENYLCLLNFEEAVNRAAADGVGLGLMARWAQATRDGDMIGGDFPAWLVDLVGRGLTLDLTDTRGECIFSACSHYRKCFIERTVRKARRAEIVVANHALVMVQAALGGGEEGLLPTRLVFDEGHHVFTAADAAFSAHLTGMETADLRRWFLGAEEGSRSRSRGLKTRLGDLVGDDPAAIEALDEIAGAARALPGPAWHQRLKGGAPVGPAEKFLSLVREQVYARAADARSAYSLEAPVHPPVPGLIEAAIELDTALGRLLGPLRTLIQGLAALLDREAADLETATRLRIESTRRTLERRGIQQAEAWRSMLAALQQFTPPEYVDWFGIERAGGQDRDLGFHRHWVDPTIPFAGAVLEQAHGTLVTSATLRDLAEEEGWEAARQRTGASHLRSEAVCAAVPSPFDYPAHTRVLVVSDLDRDDPAQVASAFRELFLAAGGGGLGLFTAISRLRHTYERIAPALEEAGIPLLAQHMDEMDTGTLIDIFRAEENTCLLGTDAVRDGVDVPGRSLRLIVFDRVPWPRPDIVFKARRQMFGGRAYEEAQTRLRLKQAFGRLVRRADDRGVFVMLDRAMPSRLADAFPPGVLLRRMGLKDAIAETRDFLGT